MTGIPNLEHTKNTDPRIVLQNNLTALFRHARDNPGLNWPDNPNALADRMSTLPGPSPKKSTAYRAAKVESAIRISHLGKIAAVYNLQAWELLCTQFNPDPAASPAKVFDRALAIIASRRREDDALVAQLGGVNGNAGGEGSSTSDDRVAPDRGSKSQRKPAA
jgi:hypothetical protein